VPPTELIAFTETMISASSSNAAVLNLLSADHQLPYGSPRAKGMAPISLFSKDINTQTDQFWKFSLA